MHMAIITKSVNSPVIINDYMLKLTKPYELEISEVITQQLRIIHNNIKDLFVEIWGAISGQFVAAGARS